MKLKLLAAGVLAGMVCASCGPKESAKGPGEVRGGKTLAGAADASKGAGRKGELRIPDAPVERPASPGGLADAVVPVVAPTDTSDVPLAPKDARWTVYCATVSDLGHVETSRALKATLIKRTGMREWYILHEGTQSRLYYGFYRSIDDADDNAETKRAQADRKKIDALVDGGGERPFKSCQFVQLNAPDPESPPQWNVVNLPPDKTWTLVVGAYKDHPDRKKAAVEAVRAARAAGEEAYYYHGETVSNVCIGAWPEAAVIEERSDPDPEAGKSGKGDILVLPSGVKGTPNTRDKHGKKVRTVSMQLVPIDPTLKAQIEKYPNMGVNGEFVVYKAGGKQRFQGTMVVQIPRPSETLFRDNVADGAQPNADGRGLEPQDPFDRPGYQDTAGRPASADKQPAGGAAPGRLRSIGKQ